jgi:hypothetical protein
MDHLTDPEIVRHFEWDAQKIFRYDGTEYKRVYTEPWTGKRFWDIQVKVSDLLKTTLTNSKVIIASRVENAVPRALRGQVETLVVWLGKGLSYYGEDPQSSGKDEEW